MTTRFNLHACAVVVGRVGLLVTGPSGSGKTSLCLDLLDHCRRHDVFGAFVADDQVFLEAHSGRLVASAPEMIAGLAELRGFGPAPVAHMPRAMMDRLVRLVPAQAAPRLAEPGTEAIGGVVLPRMDVGEGNGIASARAVAGWLALPPFIS